MEHSGDRVGTEVSRSAPGCARLGARLGTHTGLGVVVALALGLSALALNDALITDDQMFVDAFARGASPFALFGKRVVIVLLASRAAHVYAPSVRGFAGDPVPGSVHALCAGTAELTLTRTDPRTLDLHLERG